MHGLDNVKKVINFASQHLSCSTEAITTIEFKKFLDVAGYKALVHINKGHLFVFDARWPGMAAVYMKAEDYNPVVIPTGLVSLCNVCWGYN